MISAYCDTICDTNRQKPSKIKGFKRIWRESNPRHTVPETVALSPELQMHVAV